jgi:uncharacterized protein (TIGR00299 family) protein
MKAIYLDCFAGISGNMLLGAFLSAGVPAAYLKEELSKLPVMDECVIESSEAKKNGILSIYVDVRLANGHHPEEPETDQEQQHQGHRSLSDIQALLEASELSRPVKHMALQIFDELAVAEGKVHGLPKENVYFHEVGAIDSIVDIVGTAICLDYLEIEKVFVSKVNTGSGFVACAHGTMMVPAPATAELLKGIPSYHAGAEKELTTPTGAAVLSTMAEYADGLPEDFMAEKIAYGAGSWDLAIPNVLRLYLGEYQGGYKSKHYLLELNIDDMNPQIFGYVSEQLLAAGALDVWTMPIFMKKNRSAYQLSVLVGEDKKEACADIIFRETTSIGLRVIPVAERIEASRRLAEVETPYGAVSCKISAYKGRIVSVSAEYEDCRRCAQEHEVPLKTVQRSAVAELLRRLGE